MPTLFQSVANTTTIYVSFDIETNANVMFVPPLCGPMGRTRRPSREVPLTGKRRLSLNRDV